MTEGCARIRGAHLVKRLQLEPKGGQNRGDSELKTKNKNPSSGKSKHCFGFVYILPNYSACGINCATTTMFTTLMALRRHHL